MKYCPYCGADFADGAASFCMECGKSLPTAEDGQKKPKEKPVKSQKRMEKKRKHPSPKPRKKHEKPVGEHVGGAFHPKDDGYDGYYDDVLPSDAGKLKEGPDMKLVKKVSAVAEVMLLIVKPCPIKKYSGKTLGEVLAMDPNAIAWVANKYKDNQELSDAARLICEHAMQQTSV